MTLSADGEPRGWRTMRAAANAARRWLRVRGGGSIVVHRETCIANDGPGCDCAPRRLVVRAER